MVKHLLVLDDSGFKSKPLVDATHGLGGESVRVFTESRSEVMKSAAYLRGNEASRENLLMKHDLGKRYSVRKVSSLQELDNLDDLELAQVDVFFLDFKLQSERVGVLESEVSLSGATREVELSTGMGALLYLHEFLKTEQYWEKRREGRPYWAKSVGPTHSESWPKFFTYVNPTEASSWFFATAAACWFGVRQLPMNRPDLNGYLKLVVEEGRLPTWGDEGRRIYELDRVLSSMSATRMKILGEHGRDARAWIAAYPDYLASGRKVEVLVREGLVVEPIRKAFEKKKRINVPTQIEPQYEAIYGHMMAFAKRHRDPLGRHWEETLAEDEVGPRNFLDLVRDSAEFWDADDVRMAYRLWQSGALDRLGTVAVPAGVR